VTFVGGMMWKGDKGGWVVKAARPTFEPHIQVHADFFFRFAVRRRIPALRSSELRSSPVGRDHSSPVATGAKVTRVAD
jgi:hypothetical protein